MISALGFEPEIGITSLDDEVLPHRAATLFDAVLVGQQLEAAGDAETLRAAVGALRPGASIRVGPEAGAWGAWLVARLC